MVSTAQTVLPSIDRSLAARSPAQAVNSTEAKDKSFHPFGQNGFSFLDLIDVVNPLHHIPVVGPIYRDITGDVIDVLPRITGSTLFFGPIGAGLAAADVVLEESTGKDTSEHILAMLSDLVPNQTAATTPNQTRGSDDFDPIDAWLHAEAIYREQFVAGQEPTALAPKPAVPTPLRTNLAADPVLAWAQAENAYRAGLATRQSARVRSQSPQLENLNSRDMAFAKPAPRSAMPQAITEHSAVHRSGSVAPLATAKIPDGWPSDPNFSRLIRYDDHNAKAPSRNDRNAVN